MTSRRGHAKKDLPCRHLFPHITNSEEERTPRRLESMEPDLVVVVGKEKMEFHHYKATLCLGCPGIDKILAAKARMEQDTNKLEFSDMEPQVWLILYQLMEFSYITDDEKEGLLNSTLEVASEAVRCESKNKAERLLDCYNTVRDLFSWMDFFAMEELLSKYDEMTASFIENNYHQWEENIPDEYDMFCSFKILKCPLVLSFLKRVVRFKIGWYTYATGHNIKYERDDDKSPSIAKQRAIDKMKNVLLDEDCGEDIFEQWLYTVGAPKNWKDLDQERRRNLVDSTAFEYLVEVMGKSMKREPLL